MNESKNYATHRSKLARISNPFQLLIRLEIVKSIQEVISRKAEDLMLGQAS